MENPQCQDMRDRLALLQSQTAQHQQAVAISLASVDDGLAAVHRNQLTLAEDQRLLHSHIESIAALQQQMAELECVTDGV